uniref:Uncharacterized protein n=1 Tax=Anguilla anguilla TaxID=7936 RepID=A0A0E9TIP1_ANGAN
MTISVNEAQFMLILKKCIKFLHFIVSMETQVQQLKLKNEFFHSGFVTSHLTFAIQL